jgi:hypothetical protein
MVQPFGDQFLAGPAFANYEYGAIERSSTARPLDCIEKGETLPDELVAPLHDQHVVANPIFWQDISGRKPPILGDFP